MSFEELLNKDTEKHQQAKTKEHSLYDDEAPLIIDMQDVDYEIVDENIKGRK